MIPKALNQTLLRRVEDLAKQFQKSKFIDLSVKLQEPENHLIITTLPSVLSNIYKYTFKLVITRTLFFNVRTLHLKTVIHIGM